MGCALAPTFAALIVFRVFTGVFASSPIAVIGGLYADIFGDPTIRGRAMAFYMAATTMGPTMGPVIAGFISTVSWRWTFWVSLIFSGVSMPLLYFFLPGKAPSPKTQLRYD